MLIETTIGATLMFCTATRRRPESEFMLVSNGTKCVYIASGDTLEAKIMSEIEELIGVRKTAITRTGDAVRVSVIMNSMEFSQFDAVVQKELELYARYPSLTFYFDIISSSELEAPSFVNAAS
jgi:hypothetical protein